MATPYAFRSVAGDGQNLQATCYAPEGGQQLPLVAVINAGAGIPETHYKHFAEGLADRGIVTITYDYRGIGPSRPVKLRSFRATIKDWGELDAPAALRWVRERYPDRQRAVIGHSVGGFLAGFTRLPIRGIENRRTHYNFTQDWSFRFLPVRRARGFVARGHRMARRRCNATNVRVPAN